MITVLISQINLLLCLVNDILDMKMIDEDQFVTRHEEFDPTATLNFIVSMFAQTAEMQDTQLTFVETNGKLPVTLIGDQVRLKQVLVNLTKNALKFSYMKFVTLKAQYDYQNELLKVELVDGGRGISAEDINRLFHMFGKLESSADINEDGIGMGLIICKRIVDHCGGEISCKSEGVNRGSSFTFSMSMTLNKVIPKKDPKISKKVQFKTNKVRKNSKIVQASSTPLEEEHLYATNIGSANLSNIEHQDSTRKIYSDNSANITKELDSDLEELEMTVPKMNQFHDKKKKRDRKQKTEVIQPLRVRFETERKKPPSTLDEVKDLCQRGVPDVLDVEQGLLIPALVRQQNKHQNDHIV